MCLQSLIQIISIVSKNEQPLAHRKVKQNLISIHSFNKLTEDVTLTLTNLAFLYAQCHFYLNVLRKKNISTFEGQASISFLWALCCYFNFYAYVFHMVNPSQLWKIRGFIIINMQMLFKKVLSSQILLCWVWVSHIHSVSGLGLWWRWPREF